MIMTAWNWLRNSGKIEEMDEYIENLETLLRSKDKIIQEMNENGLKIRLFSGNFKRITTGEKVHFYSVYCDGNSYYALDKTGEKMFETTSFEDLLYWKKCLTHHTLLNDKLPSYSIPILPTIKEEKTKEEKTKEEITLGVGCQQPTLTNEKILEKVEEYMDKAVEKRNRKK